MSRLTILPDPDRLHLLGLSADPDTITLAVCTTSGTACCPACGGESERIHSRYTRTFADLPWQGIPVRVRLQVRRFFCDAADCVRRIFTERLPGVVGPSARRTDRLAAWFTHVAFGLGAKPAPACCRPWERRPPGTRCYGTSAPSHSPTGRRRGCGASTTSPCAGGAPTAASSSIWNAIVSSTCCQIGRRRRWPPGSGRIPV